MPLLISMRQFSEISMNFMTDFSSSTLDDFIHNTVLVIVDWYTKIVKYFSIIKSVDVCGLANPMYCHIFLMFDWSESIVSNWDSVFINVYWSAICEHIKIKRHLSITFHSQMNGQTERQNSIFKQYLRCFWSQKHSLLKPQKRDVSDAQSCMKLKAIQKGLKDKLTKA